MDEFEDGSRRFWLSLKLPWHYPYVHHATSRFTKRPLRGGPPPVDPQNEYEALVCISAHEGAHVKQAISEPKGKGYWQTRGSKRVFIEARRYSEVEAEYAEYELLNRFRERSSP